MFNYGGNRVHIIGGPGSGKTTLARQAAACLQAPYYELDKVGYEDGAGAERPLELRLADVRQIAMQPAWITEGVFLGWTHELFEAADTVVWLDLPWRVVGWRIFKRHVMAELSGTNRHSGWRKLYRFMQWSHLYYEQTVRPQDVIPGSDINENRAITEQYLMAFKDKLVQCSNQAAVKEYFESLSPGILH